MWETLRNVWRVPELRKKVLYTFFMLLIFRLVSVIPVPGLDPAVMQQASETYDMLGLMNMMTGSSLSQMTIMAMGISPYINASIIMQLLTIAIPALERLQKEGGEEGKKKIQQITRYVTIGLAALQAIGIVAGLGAIKPGYANFFGYVAIGIILAGGTALAMWIGEQITKNGIGNGISLLIFTGIIANLFNGILTTTQGIFTGANTVGQLVIILLTTLVILVVVTLVDLSERRIPVQYAKRVVGRKMYGGQSTHIPMKLLSVGVLPLIFAYSFMAFPGTIFAMFGTSSKAYIWWSTYMNQTSFWYMLICALLIALTGADNPGVSGVNTIGVFALSVTGACVGFLRFNRYPAKVFMGDTGSMLLGGAAVAAAMLLRRPLLLILLFFTPIMSSVSVILQRYYFKLTHGKRIFLMSPIHHHFEKKGYSETQIVSMYAGITLVLTLIGVLSVCVR